MTKKETYELVIKQLLANIEEIDFADYEGDAIEEAPTISVCNSYGELGGVTIYMVSIDHKSGDVMVELRVMTVKLLPSICVMLSPTLTIMRGLPMQFTIVSSHTK